MDNIKFITLNTDYDGYIEDIVDFYKPKYKKTFNEDTVLNSTIICLAIIDDKIVGAVRALSDLSRFGTIIDLVVENNFRNNGIGTTLTNNITKELLKHNVATISLTTEPESPWLVHFYERNGFKTIPDSIHMMYKPNEYNQIAG